MELTVKTAKKMRRPIMVYSWTELLEAMSIIISSMLSENINSCKAHISSLVQNPWLWKISLRNIKFIYIYIYIIYHIVSFVADCQHS